CRGDPRHHIRPRVGATRGRMTRSVPWGSELCRSRRTSDGRADRRRLRFLGASSLPVMARGDRLREWLDRLHPSGLLYTTYEHRLIAELDPDRLPRHVAVLADGNRRWARANAPGKPLVAGYQAG